MRMPHRDHGTLLGKRTIPAITVGAGPERGEVKKGTQVVGNGLYLPGCIKGSVANFLVNTGSGCRSWRPESGGDGSGRRTSCRSIGADCARWRDGLIHGTSE